MSDRSRFSRRLETRAFGPKVLVTAPGDTILQKLKWAREIGGSGRQLRDAVGVYELQGHTLDQYYLDAWARKLDVLDLLAQVRAQAVEE